MYGDVFASGVGGGVTAVAGWAPEVIAYPKLATAVLKPKRTDRRLRVVLDRFSSWLDVDAATMSLSTRHRTRLSATQTARATAFTCLLRGTVRPRCGPRRTGVGEARTRISVCRRSGRGRTVDRGL